MAFTISKSIFRLYAHCMRPEPGKLSIEWKEEMRFVPALGMYIAKGEVVEMPRLIAENLIVQGFAVKHKSEKACSEPPAPPVFV